MAATALETRSTTEPTVAPSALRQPVAPAIDRPHDIGAARRAPSLARRTFLAVALIAGLGVLVWHLAGGGVDGAIVAGIVTAGLALLVGAYASVFVSRDR